MDCPCRYSPFAICVRPSPNSPYEWIVSGEILIMQSLFERHLIDFIWSLIRFAIKEVDCIAPRLREVH